MNRGHGTFSMLFTLLLLVVLLSSSRSMQASSAPNLSLGNEWREAVGYLNRLPVQDTGFVRSGLAFSQNLVSAISGGRSVGKVDAMESILYLMRDPHNAHAAPIMKITHPDLVAIYGSQWISVDQWRDLAYRDQVIHFLHGDQEARLPILNSIEYRVQLLESLEDEFAIFPRSGEWLTPAQARHGENLSTMDVRILEQWDLLRAALRSDDAKAGVDASRQLVETVTQATAELNKSLPPLDMEMFYHSHQPFRNAAAFYLLSALLFTSGLLLGRQTLSWVGVALLGVGFIEHAMGLSIRWILAERGPFSNMYESFVFAIGGMILVALVLECSRTVRLAGLGASILGFVFMVIAHKAPIFDSQIRPLVPALQSSWLTYHVVTIMIGYSAFALSFFVAILYLLKDGVLGGDAGKNLLARQLPSLRTLDVFNYRIIAIGFPLLTLGIVLGAVWAATAWGRPWGFDPKETWSAITWLIYAVYLHMRYMAGWGGRSSAIISIIGFLAVLFTYLGVNYLLPGLHSYV
jgi:cytochrome c-type biogenesis protein CcsB